MGLLGGFTSFSNTSTHNCISFAAESDKFIIIRDGYASWVMLHTWFWARGFSPVLAALDCSRPGVWPNVNNSCKLCAQLINLHGKRWSNFLIIARDTWRMIPLDATRNATCGFQGVDILKQGSLKQCGKHVLKKSQGWQVNYDSFGNPLVTNFFRVLRQHSTRVILTNY